jgi:ATP-dependent Clp protease ATP-binding subunit ClpC
MFERYTEKARRVIFFARYEASQCGSPYIEMEQMLLGLMREARPLFESLLSTQGSAKLEAEIRSAVAEPREKISTSVDLPLSNAARRTLAYAAEEAERFNHKYIDTVHLLHGLMLVPSPTADVLRKYGLEIEDLRRKLAQPAGALTLSPAEIQDELRREFMPIVRRLTPEVEPAVVFRLEPYQRETGS